MAPNLKPVVAKFVVPATASDGVPYSVEFDAHGGNAREVVARAESRDEVNGEVTVVTASSMVGNGVTNTVTVEDPLGQATISKVDATHWLINP